MSRKKKQNRETRLRVEREQMFPKHSVRPSLLTLLVTMFSKRKDGRDGSDNRAG